MSNFHLLHPDVHLLPEFPRGPTRASIFEEIDSDDLLPCDPPKTALANFLLGSGYRPGGTAATICVHRDAPRLSDPDLQIKLGLRCEESDESEAGPIRIQPLTFPLSDIIATDLVDRASPFLVGIFDRTELCPEVRNSVEFDSGEVQILSRSYQDRVNEMATEMLLDLDPGALSNSSKTVSAHLYKLLIYGPGSFFRKHRDTEKREGMVATMIVQLPSKFEGGTLKYYNGIGEMVKQVDWGISSSMDTARCSLHYVDTEYEVVEITNGFRCCLVFNVCVDDLNNKWYPMKVPEPVRSVSGFKLDHPEMPNQFVLMLAHRYSENSLEVHGASALRGPDRSLFERLRGMGMVGWRFQIAPVQYQYTIYTHRDSMRCDRIEDAQRANSANFVCQSRSCNGEGMWRCSLSHLMSHLRGQHRCSNYYEEHLGVNPKNENEVARVSRNQCNRGEQVRREILFEREVVEFVQESVDEVDGKSWTLGRVFDLGQGPLFSSDPLFNVNLKRGSPPCDLLNYHYNPTGNLFNEVGIDLKIATTLPQKSFKEVWGAEFKAGDLYGLGQGGAATFWQERYLILGKKIEEDTSVDEDE